MDKGSGKPPIPPKPATRNRKLQVSRQPNATSDFGGFPILPPPEPLFRWFDVTESFQGKAITPNSPELLENEESPRARQVCKFYHDGNKICPWGFGCPDLHGIFGIQDRRPAGEGVGTAAVERAAPLSGRKRKAGFDDDDHSQASGSKRQP